MRITSKGQITIPAEIREQLGFLPSTEVRFEVDGEGLRLVRIPAHKGPSRGSKALDLLRGRATVPLTTEEILALTRGE
jgi:AbrB family looped-hinge helix DNA binding protein